MFHIYYENTKSVFNQVYSSTWIIYGKALFKSHLNTLGIRIKYWSLVLLVPMGQNTETAWVCNNKCLNRLNI